MTVPVLDPYCTAKQYASVFKPDLPHPQFDAPDAVWIVKFSQRVLNT